jgi:hypothetical protein
MGGIKPKETQYEKLQQLNNIYVTSLSVGFITFGVTASGPRSVVGINTGYGLDGPGFESGGGRHFPHLSRPALGPI